VDLTGLHGEIDSLEDFFVADVGVEILDFEQSAVSCERCSTLRLLTADG
jgi:hypothetical protein